MEPFGFDQLPEVVRQLVEKVEGIEILIQNLQPQKEEEQKMLEFQEAAAFLNITVSALYSLVSRKDISMNKPAAPRFNDSNSRCSSMPLSYNFW